MKKAPRPDKMYYVPVVNGCMDFILKAKTRESAEQNAIKEGLKNWTIETFWISEI